MGWAGERCVPVLQEGSAHFVSVRAPIRMCTGHQYPFCSFDIWWESSPSFELGTGIHCPLLYFQQPQKLWTSSWQWWSAAWQWAPWRSRTLIPSLWTCRQDQPGLSLDCAVISNNHLKGIIRACQWSWWSSCLWGLPDITFPRQHNLKVIHDLLIQHR